MKSYLVTYKQKNSDHLDEELLNEHVNYLKDLHRRGKLLLAGPFMDFKEAMLIMRADDLEQIEYIVKHDPFIVENFYLTYEIKEFIEANERNNWLLGNDKDDDEKQPKNLHVQPKVISVLHRKLKPSCTYQDFREAWFPPVEYQALLESNMVVDYFDIPVQVINAVNVQDETEIISIGLVNSSLEEVQQGMQQYETTESQRRERIAKVADKSQEAKIYLVKSIDELG